MYRTVFMIHGARVGLVASDARVADEFGRDLSPVIAGRGDGSDADVLAVYEVTGADSNCSATVDGAALPDGVDWADAENFEVADGLRVYLDYGRLAVKVSARDAGTFDEALLALVGLVEYVLRLFLHRSARLAVFHAAAWDVRGAGVLLPGVSGSGKTSLSFLMEGRGHGLVSDEDSFVVSEAGALTLRPYPRRLRVAGGILTAYPELSDRPSRPYTAFGGEGLLFEHPGRPASDAPLAALVFLDNDPAHDGPPSLVPVDDRARAHYMLLAAGERYPAHDHDGPLRTLLSGHNRALFGVAREVVDAVPAYRLSFDITRHYRLVPGLVEGLVEEVRGAGRAHGQPCNRMDLVEANRA